MSSEEDKTKVYSDGVVFLHHSVGCAQIPRQAWYLWHPQTKSGAKLFIVLEEPSWRNLEGMEQVVTIQTFPTVLHTLTYCWQDRKGSMIAPTLCSTLLGSAFHARQTLICRGEREFPFPTIPGNTGLPFPFPNLGMSFSFPFPFPKVGNAFFDSRSRSQNLGMQFSIPVPITGNGLSRRE